MKLPLNEPLFAKYLYVSSENIVQVFMPVVSGTGIGLDNTCKAVYSLQEFFGKGTNSNKKTTLKGELLAYKETLESDLSLLGVDSVLAQQKQERLTQIEAYLKVVTHIEHHRELECLNKGFPSYPSALESMMQDRSTSNLYSMVLHPTEEDGFLRSEAANPVFSVAHKSETRKIEHAVSPLYQTLIQAYTPLTYEARDLKSQVVQQTITQLMPLKLPVDFERLRQVLQNTLKALLNVDVDLSKTQQDTLINQHSLHHDMGFNPQTTAPQEYIEALLGYCVPNVFDTAIESPFNYLTQAEHWSIATQFLLGITNIYAQSQGIISKDTNFGHILDSNLALSKDLAQTLIQAQNAHNDIEDRALSWLNAHATELELKSPFTQEDVKAIKKTFATLYSQIKDAPHFDEFLVLDTQKKGDFVIHQGHICTSFAKFVSSTLFGLTQELTQPLEKACAHASTLSTEIPHKNSLVQGEVEINTTAMDNTALQALYEQINSYKNPKLKEHLLAQFKQERPDFKPQIDAKQFLQHVAYGEQNEAKSLLKKDIDTAQELLTARNIPFTDYSGRTFTCTAYEYAYWAKDTHMCRMLEKNMDDQTKHIILQQVQNIEELIGPGLIKKPRGLTYTQQGVEYRSAHFDLAPLKTALKTYIEAYNASPKNTKADWEALDVLWIKVGLPQREVPAHIAHEYCHPKRSFEDVVNNPALLDASNKTNLTRQLAFNNWETHSDDVWYTPAALAGDSGLGSSFAILRAGMRRGAAGGSGVARQWLDLAAIEALDDARTKDLKQSLENLAAPSNLKTLGCHGS